MFGDVWSSNNYCVHSQRIANAKYIAFIRSLELRLRLLELCILLRMVAFAQSTSSIFICTDCMCIDRTLSIPEHTVTQLNSLLTIYVLPNKNL